MKKKFILSLGMVTAIATPIAAVISCGVNKVVDSLQTKSINALPNIASLNKLIVTTNGLTFDDIKIQSYEKDGNVIINIKSNVEKGGKINGTWFNPNDTFEVSLKAEPTLEQNGTYSFKNYEFNSITAKNNSTLTGAEIKEIFDTLWNIDKTDLSPILDNLVNDAPYNVDINVDNIKEKFGTLTAGDIINHDDLKIDKLGGDIKQMFMGVQLTFNNYNDTTKELTLNISKVSEQRNMFNVDIPTGKTIVFKGYINAENQMTKFNDITGLAIPTGDSEFLNGIGNGIDKTLLKALPTLDANFEIDSITINSIYKNKSMGVKVKVKNSLTNTKYNEKVIGLSFE